MPQLKSYLLFQDRITQIWINKYTILCILVLFKLTLFGSQVQKSLQNVETSIIDNGNVCSYYDLLLNDTPYYMSIVANKMIEKSIEESIKLSLKLLSIMVMAFEKVLVFMFDIWFGTYECLLVSAVDGTIDVAVNVTESIIDVANKSVHTIAKDLNKGLGDLSGVLNDVVDDFNKLESKLKDIFDSHKTSYNDSTTDLKDKVSTINLTVAKLADFYINPTINTNLQKLSSEVPDFTTVKNKSRSWIEIPFKKVINDLNNINITRYTKFNNVSLKPIEFAKSINTTSSRKTYGYCESVIIPELKEIFKVFNKVVKDFQIIIICVLIVCAIGFCVPEFFKELFLWRKLYKLDNFVKGETEENENENDNEKENVFSDSKCILSSFSPSCTNQQHTDIIGNYFNVFQSWEVNILSRIPGMYFLSNSRSITRTPLSRRTLQKTWLFHYVLSKRSTLLLLISVTGILCCFIQYTLIFYLHKILKDISSTSSNTGINKYELIAKNTMSNMSLDFNKSFQNWNNNTLTYINTVQNSLNNEVVIKSISTITETLNTTVTDVLDDMNLVITHFFNNTILEKPTLNIMNCVIGNKLKTIIEGLTWIHKELKIDIYKDYVSDTQEIYTLMTSTWSGNTTTNSTFLSTSSTPQLDTGFDKNVYEIYQKIVNELNKVISLYKSSIKSELIISVTLLSLWLLQIPIGLSILHFHYKN